MAEPPDLQDLAKRYLDLWQDQLRAMAADPETMAAVGRMIAGAAAEVGQPGTAGAASPGIAGAPNPFAFWPLAGMAPGMTSGMTPFGGATPFDSAFTAGRADAPAGAQAAPGSSDDRGDELRQLERRLAALEERLTAMEPGARSKGRGGKAKSRKGKR